MVETYFGELDAVCLSSDKRDKWGQMSQMSFRGDGDKPPLVYVQEVCPLSLCPFVVYLRNL
jgi:hypothetical protein